MTDWRWILRPMKRLKEAVKKHEETARKLEDAHAVNAAARDKCYKALAEKLAPVPNGKKEE